MMSAYALIKTALCSSILMTIMFLFLSKIFLPSEVFDAAKNRLFIKNLTNFCSVNNLSLYSLTQETNVQYSRLNDSCILI